MIIYTDGSGKTGKYAYVAETKSGIVHREFRKPGITNNEAEYLAVIFALTDFSDKEITLRSDSQLIVNQLNHEYAIKEDRLRELASRVWSLCEGRSVEFVWVPRERNKAGKLLG
jgi:ribonuclease HI